MLSQRVNFSNNVGDPGNLRNPFFAAKAPYGIANGISCDIDNFEFRCGVTIDGNLLPFWQKILVGSLFLILKLD